MDIVIICILALAAIGLCLLYQLSRKKKSVVDSVVEPDEKELPPAVEFSSRNKDLGLPLLKEVEDSKYCLLSDLSLGDTVLASTPYGELETTCYSINGNVCLLKTNDSEYEVAAINDVIPDKFGKLSNKSIWRITDVRRKPHSWLSRMSNRPLLAQQDKYLWFKNYVVYGDTFDFIDSMLLLYLVSFADDGGFLEPTEDFSEGMPEDPVVSDPVEDGATGDGTAGDDIPVGEDDLGSDDAENTDTDTSYGYDAAY